MRLIFYCCYSVWCNFSNEQLLRIARSSKGQARFNSCLIADAGIDDNSVELLHEEHLTPQYTIVKPWGLVENELLKKLLKRPEQRIHRVSEQQFQGTKFQASWWDHLASTRWEIFSSSLSILNAENKGGQNGENSLYKSCFS